MLHGLGYASRTLMKKPHLHVFPILAAIALCAVSGRSAADQPGQFESIFRLVRTNLVGLDVERYEREALRGLLRRMDGKVQLLKADEVIGVRGELVNEAKVFEGKFGYVRVRAVEEGLADSLREGLKGLIPSGDLRGLMVDLRFADGSDYEAAVRTVNEFVGRDETQLLVGERHLRTIQKSDLIRGPVAILVNSETGGAAEALAALFRRNEVGLLIGSKTAGETKVFSDFSLENGNRLRVATGEVRSDDGLELSSGGLQPDILVPVDPGAERKFFGDAYAVPKGRKQPRGLVNEAALVRQLRQRLNPDVAIPSAPAKEEAPREVFDPTLARALDLLKGLNLLAPSK